MEEECDESERVRKRRVHGPPPARALERRLVAGRNALALTEPATPAQLPTSEPTVRRSASHEKVAPVRTSTENKRQDSSPRGGRGGRGGAGEEGASLFFSFSLLPTFRVKKPVNRQNNSVVGSIEMRYYATRKAGTCKLSSVFQL